jgi:hypothetical protein
MPASRILCASSEASSTVTVSPSVTPTTFPVSVSAGAIAAKKRRTNPSRTVMGSALPLGHRGASHGAAFLLCQGGIKWNPFKTVLPEKCMRL